ncbi:hypothetical protein SNEBB_006255 [Seison nebaliae]|nr:hypothetical protein SNEBB_006255 [Seison nebaliae]
MNENKILQLRKFLQLDVNESDKNESDDAISLPSLVDSTVSSSCTDLKSGKCRRSWKKPYLEESNRNNLLRNDDEDFDPNFFNKNENSTEILLERKTDMRNDQHIIDDGDDDHDSVLNKTLIENSFNDYELLTNNDLENLLNKIQLKMNEIINVELFDEQNNNNLFDKYCYFFTKFSKNQIINENPNRTSIQSSMHVLMELLENEIILPENFHINEIIEADEQFLMFLCEICRWSVAATHICEDEILFNYLLIKLNDSTDQLSEMAYQVIYLSLKHRSATIRHQKEEIESRTRIFVEEIRQLELEAPISNEVEKKMISNSNVRRRLNEVHQELNRELIDLEDQLKSCLLNEKHFQKIQILQSSLNSKMVLFKLFRSLQSTIEFEEEMKEVESIMTAINMESYDVNKRGSLMKFDCIETASKFIELSSIVFIFREMVLASSQKFNKRFTLHWMKIRRDSFNILTNCLCSLKSFEMKEKLVEKYPLILMMIIDHLENNIRDEHSYMRCLSSPIQSSNIHMNMICIEISFLRNFFYNSHNLQKIFERIYHENFILHIFHSLLNYGKFLLNNYLLYFTDMLSEYTIPYQLKDFNKSIQSINKVLSNDQRKIYEDNCLIRSIFPIVYEIEHCDKLENEKEKSVNLQIHSLILNTLQSIIACLWNMVVEFRSHLFKTLETFDSLIQLLTDVQLILYLVLYQIISNQQSSLIPSILQLIINSFGLFKQLLSIQQHNNLLKIFTKNFPTKFYIQLLDMTIIMSNDKEIERYMQCSKSLFYTSSPFNCICCNLFQCISTSFTNQSNRSNENLFIKILNTLLSIFKLTIKIDNESKLFLSNNNQLEETLQIILSKGKQIDKDFIKECKSFTNILQQFKSEQQLSNQKPLNIETQPDVLSVLCSRSSSTASLCSYNDLNNDLNNIEDKISVYSQQFASGYLSPSDVPDSPCALSPKQMRMQQMSTNEKIERLNSIKASLKRNTEFESNYSISKLIRQRCDKRTLSRRSSRRESIDSKNRYNPNEKERTTPMTKRSRSQYPQSNENQFQNMVNSFVENNRNEKDKCPNNNKGNLGNNVVDNMIKSVLESVDSSRRSTIHFQSPDKLKENEKVQKSGSSSIKSADTIETIHLLSSSSSSMKSSKNSAQSLLNENNRMKNIIKQKFPIRSKKSVEQKCLSSSGRNVNTLRSYTTKSYLRDTQTSLSRQIDTIHFQKCTLKQFIKKNLYSSSKMGRIIKTLRKKKDKQTLRLQRLSLRTGLYRLTYPNSSKSDWEKNKELVTKVNLARLNGYYKQMQQLVEKKNDINALLYQFGYIREI